MWRTEMAVSLALMAAGCLAAGCTSDPIESDEPSVVVKRCCAEAQERVATVNDIATDDFRARCDACRRGKPKSGCSSAAAKVNDTVKAAYGEFSMPMSCTRMKAELAELGIE